MNNDKKVFDLIVIGGGPVGLFTAFYAGMRKMSVNIIESLPQLGGQLSALYPEKYIYDIAGFPKIRGQDLIDNLTDQMSQFEPIITLEQDVQQVEKQENGIFKLTTNCAVHYSKAIIITAGNGAFQPKKINLNTSDKFEGKNLHYFIKDLNQFANKNVQIFGGGDSAVDWALMLEPIAKKVTLVHRRDKFRAHESSVENLMNSTVNIMTPYVPIKFIGENKIEKVVFEKGKSLQEIIVEVDDVIVNYGFVSSLGSINDWGLEIEKNSIVVNSKMETNIEGIYAAGDICTYEGKVKLIASGFGEAPTAVSNAKVYVDPTARVQATHSTTLMEHVVTEKVKMIL
ncbi:NAD(P)/FAD-dependent oxidoreductase [Paenisporosarcina antarctica]|uniref:Ferredoxin--NADP reductase n=1 Tax=Paenisporosarcina antarctica TaxID=417367 RepID=A0A4V1AN08_9BACL|nr:NAD(P)/FAD-dependent oxidoreductase [Paenisporosarcina antarctica]QBP41125.1 NAD(P)/FAD-dependent oxidoreductase [Paenisporosarcina antarctica]